MVYGLFQLSSSVVIRKEHFGGILFNKSTGDLIEVDKEAFVIISIIKGAGIVDMKNLLALTIYNKERKVDVKRIKGVISELCRIGMVEIMPNGVLAENAVKILENKSQITVKWPQRMFLSAPETAHWAVTFQCNSGCPDCYVERHRKLFKKELDTKEAFELVDKIASAGIFQLAIGGGEPFMRKDLEAIVRHASEKGLIVHITTGKYKISRNRLDALTGYIKTIQIGIRSESLLNGENETVSQLKELVTQLSDRDIVNGANLIMTRSSIKNLDEIMDILLEIGFKRFTFLRYKPPADIKRWLQEKPDQGDWVILERQLPLIKGKHSGIHIRIDCALSFLERQLEPQKAVYSGIKGCVAGERIVSIAPDGSVFPCSQLVGEIFKAGNLIDEEFDTIWDRDKVIKRYRSFRNNKNFKRSNCGRCTAKNSCGGCRVFADDAFGMDPGCPENYYETEYPDDEYDDIITDIQDMIGYTNAGFPYATHEEIEKWLEEENDRGYPAWIRNIKV